MRPRCSVWADLTERRTAYFAVRDELLEIQPPGSRPWAYWAIDVGELPSWPLGEQVWLFERGPLSPDEEAAILATDRVSPQPAAALIRAKRRVPERAARVPEPLAVDDEKPDPAWSEV